MRKYRGKHPHRIAGYETLDVGNGSRMVIVTNNGARWLVVGTTDPLFGPVVGEEIPSTVVVTRIWEEK